MMQLNLVIMLLITALSPAFAQSPAPVASSEDLKAIRLLLEQQSRQLETLTLQVSRLAQLLESREPAAAAPMTQNMPPAATAVATATPGRTHVVTKGDTLVSIAKRYEVDVDALRRINNIEDVRKLQIGQVLTVPEVESTATPAPAPTAGAQPEQP
jgi:LysM repeat protein